MWHAQVTSGRAYHIASVMPSKSPKVGQVVPVHVGDVSSLVNGAMPSRLRETAVPRLCMNWKLPKKGEKKIG